MDRSQRRCLQSDAAEALHSAAYSPRRLTLIHVAVGSLFSLALFAITFFLNHQIDQTSGLGGIGTRSLLETAQTILQYANILLLPFWELGFLWAVMCIGRRQEADISSLLQGFRKFGPLLRGKIVQCLVLWGAMLAGAYVGMLICSFTPVFEALYTAMEPYWVGLTIDYAALATDEAVTQAIFACTPFMLVGGAVFAVPVFYRIRLMDYIQLDPPRHGGFFALWKSAAMMRGNRRSLFLLDLRFWWYYLLELVIGIVCYGDLILPMFGVELGISEDVALFAFYLIALVFQLGLYVWKKPLVFTTYARFYDSLLPTEEAAAENS